MTDLKEKTPHLTVVDEAVEAAPNPTEADTDHILPSSDNGLEQETALAVRSHDHVARPRLIEMRQQVQTDSENVSAENTLQQASGASSRPAQVEFPFALVQGEPMTQIPEDLYIPPAALEVFLETFEGPLDLLLYLIKRQNLDILEINVAEMTEQYMQYVRLMDTMQFELASEYLVMAAMLAEIKSRMLLPRSQNIDEDDEDPRSQLIRRLQEYERFKQVAQEIQEMPRVERDIFIAEIDPPDDDRPRPVPDIDLKELLVALGDVLHRADMFESHHIEMETLSTRERMGNVLDRLNGSEDFVDFAMFFTAAEGRGGVVVTFLAIMELIKESLIEIVQAEPFGPIHVRPKAA